MVPVKQKNKVRPIDDYKANRVNQFVTQSERVTVRAIDYIVSMAAYWLKASQGRKGRLDLKRSVSDAYKQIPFSDQAYMC